MNYTTNHEKSKMNFIKQDYPGMAKIMRDTGYQENISHESEEKEDPFKAAPEGLKLLGEVLYYPTD